MTSSPTASRYRAEQFGFTRQPGGERGHQRRRGQERAVLPDGHGGIDRAWAAGRRIWRPLPASLDAAVRDATRRRPPEQTPTSSGGARGRAVSGSSGRLPQGRNGQQLRRSPPPRRSATWWQATRYQCRGRPRYTGDRRPSAPKGFATSIPHSPTDRPHVANIVNRSLYYPGGLAELVDIVQQRCRPRRSRPYRGGGGHPPPGRPSRAKVAGMNALRAARAGLPIGQGYAQPGPRHAQHPGDALARTPANT